ncbi:zinc ABC transporter substrate-binding protein [Candidatus Uhrbacteria bacterium]|nr:zinc ABC transporter substrate-binding protein [Candidatus Uhrbacteria bacterium]
MKKLLMVLLIFGAVIAALILNLDSEEIVSDDRPVTATTIFPLYDIVQNIAGDSIRVELIMPVGASPHTFEPSASLLRDLKGVSVIYAIGYGSDDWASVIGENLGAEIVTVDSDIDLHQTNDGIDPHYWLSFTNANIIAKTVRDDLNARFPEYTYDFDHNASLYTLSLQEVNQEALRLITEEVDSNNIITLHDAWYYFANDLGLNVVGTFEPSGGREPTPQYLIDLIETIDESDIITLYTEPQLSEEAFDTFVHDNNLSVGYLDPIGGTADKMSFIDLMLSNVQSIANNQ